MKASHKIEKILIAIEDSPYSEKALSYGHHLAIQMSAQVALVHVNDLPLMPNYVGNMVVGELPTISPELMTLQEEATQKLFERIIRSWKDEISVHTFSRLGNVRDEILDVAEQWHADLIILGTHGRTGFDHFISGSVAESVARKAHCPVLIIPNKEN
ncbi:MAG: universal stress protein [Sphingobacteriaceae bacterium]